MLHSRTAQRPHMHWGTDRDLPLPLLQRDTALEALPASSPAAAQSSSVPGHASSSPSTAILNVRSESK